jgi:micrococcal nuclease
MRTDFALVVDSGRHPQELNLSFVHPWRTALVVLIPVAGFGCGSREVPILGDEDVCQPPVEADVVGVVDGDTIDVRREGSAEVERIRLLGIQAGEIFYNDGEQNCTSQADGECCYGTQADGWLTSLLERVDTLTLGFDSECTDTYGRTLGYIWIDDPLDSEETEPWFVNEEILALGIARYFDDEIGQAQNIRFKADFQAAESRAAIAELGLWSFCE